MVNISLFSPSEGDYTSRAAELARQKKLADMLIEMSQQEMPVSTAGGITAPVSPYGALAKALTSFGGSYLSGKAAQDEAALKKQDREMAQDALKNLYTQPDTKQLALAKELASPVETEMAFNMPSYNVATANLKMPSPNGTTDMTLPITMPKMPGEYNQQTTANISLPGVSRAEVETVRGRATTPEEQMQKISPLREGGDESRSLYNALMSDIMKRQAADIENNRIRTRESLLPKPAGISEESWNAALDTPGLRSSFFKTAGEEGAKNAAKPAMSPSEIANIKIRIKQIALTQGTEAAKAAYEGVFGVPGFDANSFLNEVLGASAPQAPNVAQTPIHTVPKTPVNNFNASSNQPSKKPVSWVDPNSPHWTGLSPKQKSEGIFELRKNQLQEHGNSISQLGTIDRLANGIDDLLTNPGLDKISGPIAQYTWPSSKEGQAARNTFNSLASTAAIQQINELRQNSKSGGAVGNVTEAEWGRLAEAAGMLSRSTSSEDVKRNLKNYKETLLGIKNKINDAYFNVYGEKLNYTPSKYTPYATPATSNAQNFTTQTGINYSFADGN